MDIKDFTQELKKKRGAPGERVDDPDKLNVSRVLNIEIDEINCDKPKPDKIVQPTRNVPPIVIDKENNVVKGSLIYWHCVNIGAKVTGMIRLYSGDPNKAVNYGDEWEVKETATVKKETKAVKPKRPGKEVSE